MGEARDYIKEIGIAPLVFGYNRFPYTFINDMFPAEVDYDASVIRILNFDIETEWGTGFPDIETADKAITAVTMKCQGRVYVFGLVDYVPHRHDVEYTKCEDEAKLLQNVVRVWRKLDPDILTGWNIEFFDCPYLANRIKRVLGDHQAKRLSPFGIIEMTKTKPPGKPEGEGKLGVDIVGISQLDYLALYKKFSFRNHESYRLDYISKEVLGEGKVDFAEYGNLGELYIRNPQLYIEYNIGDVDRVDRLEDKLGMIQMVVANAYDTKTNYEDSFTTVKLWDTIIHNHLLAQKIVIPTANKPGDKRYQIIGGYVKEPQVGFHEWVVSFDYDRLYPSLIEAYNISPDTYAGKIDGITVSNALAGRYDDEGIRTFITQNDVALTPGGHYYSRDKQGFFPALMELKAKGRTKNKNLMLEAKAKLAAAESEYKKTPTVEIGTRIKALERDVSRYHNMQLALKIQLNAAYGALSNEYFRWYDDRLAESVTMSGQLAILWLEKKINSYLNDTLFKNAPDKKQDYVIAMDTDSLYVRLSQLVSEIYPRQDIVRKSVIVGMLDRGCKLKIEPYVQKCCDELCDYTNAFAKTLKMKREAIADKAIWSAGKNYILNVWDQEGVTYDAAKLKLVGISAVKSSTPSVCRTAVSESLNIVMNGTNDQLIEYVSTFRDRFNSMSFEDVAFPRGVSDIDKYYHPQIIFTKGAQAHIRSALIYNHLIKKLGLQNKYQSVSNGDKIKFAYLLEPNPIHQSVVGTPGTLPEEFEIEKYVDKDMQFAKAFVEPLKAITDIIGWKLETESTLF